MNEIITISQTMINNTEVNSVNARDLHEVLESDTKFSDWIKRRLDETDAILNADYIIVSQKRETITEYGKKGKRNNRVYPHNRHRERDSDDGAKRKRQTSKALFYRS